MTDRDYTDMVNPYVRAEEEAFKRGHSEGLAAGIFYALCAIIALGMLLVALDAHAADWTYEESPRVIRASERDARLTVCQQNAIERGWQCFIVK